ncbi:MAG TPA: carboxypeptidase regulatory-like domain-containing protein [Bryobacteraceae bacterium]|nr:carboxypeptidase regulatory-like domain-containing protein [Bryobacteraceae bacterium]
MIRRLLRSLIAAGLVVFNLLASEQHGQVTFGGLPVPGATVTATQGDKKITAVTDPEGAYTFPDLADGVWTIQVDMLGFSTLKRDVTIGKETQPGMWELKMLSLDEIHAEAQSAAPPKPVAAGPASATAEQQKPEAKPSVSETEPARDEMAQRAADGLLINGSVNNGASSPFALFPAFGNNRNGSRSLYNGGLGVFVNNSIWDARQFSLTGQDTAKPGYNFFTGTAYFGGPLKIPHLLKKGPNFFVGYQWTRNRSDNTTTALMPTLAERGGNLSQVILPIIDPLTGAPFVGNVIPQSRISPQAQALLNLYPLPNFAGNSSYNYQVPLVGVTHQDSLQSRLNQSIDRKNQVFGNFAFQSSRQANPNVFGFLDTTDTLGLTASATWFHRFSQGIFGTFQYQFSRFSSDANPFFANRENISGAAGINGNDQSPMDWGPPSLNFISVQGLSDTLQASNHNETNAVSSSFFWNHARHNFQFGGDFKKQQFNVLGQQNGRGSFTFTGGATGSDFADFLLGVPDVASVAFGNADKYFRGSLYDAFFNDDWRISSAFTLNAGLRWEYGSPATELYGRLVNLDVIPGFQNEAPVVASNPTGALTGLHYPDSLIRPDKRGFEPRIAIAWRPLPASSLVIRAGYGVYYDTSVYQTLATQMAQQSPLSKSLSVQNTPANPLTLAEGFNAPPATTPNTFGIDPNYRPGYAQNWNFSVQRDLPGSLQMTATYIGIKGTHGTQEFLPNTYAAGATNPCPLCPAGYEYITSNGNSTREAGSIQLRRRLHSGFTATVQYTFAKAIDDDAVLGGVGASASTPVASAAPGAAAVAGPRNLVVAQNWLDLSAERSLSTFDQRHLVNATIQYTTGMGLAGGTLLNGWRGTLFKGWMFTSTILAGSGLPLTPSYLAPVQGTGVTNALRPNYTGASVYDAPPGLSLNPAAYAAPPSGQFGNAGRDSITGPSQFTLNASAGRTFRLTDRLSGDLRIDSTNPINHVTFPSWNTTFGSAQFGLPLTANAMRSLTTGFMLRF